DFVLQNGMDIDLVEVKSGKDAMKHPSLDKVIAVREWKFRKTIVLCRENIMKIDRIVYLPWYASMFIRRDDLPAGEKYNVETDDLINYHE
ncbi:MAG: ATP-binding protein, partial [Saccharofermentanales bacterium]